MNTMLVARTTAKQTLSFEKVATPSRSPGHCLVRVASVSLCGTDLHIFDDDYPSDLPIVQGHEICGAVFEADPDGNLVAGDRVVVDPLIACGQCAVCRAGHANVCPKLSVLGCYTDGGLAEVLNVPTPRLHRVPHEMDDDAAALAEPTSIALEAVTRAEPRAGDVALVLGCGPIGLLSSLALVDRGATVVAADIDEQRTALARRLGATHTFVVGTTFPDPKQHEVLAALTEGMGPRIIIEATGAPTSLMNAIRTIAPAGRIVQVGISTGSATIAVKDLTDKEIELHGSRNSRGLIPEALSLLHRHPAAASALITHRFAFTELGEALRTMADHTVPTGKIVIHVSGSLEVS
ncbi:2-deoxy-scyllo-inosamine dehydrogenase [Microbacterium protaetiae]|uniref:2-deoxy-scyllo-inosamine dehydrogenase n=1 Tax=Microbacterium protaetiae TaxID=2509458 RepID=A0A4P6EB02_9MICO|nr:alcohol dehydrogenase catalytic domain-containing protein [Microbacterium protaetiae]QAY59295.1 2-deoxy-scyllo-inosamine dehydrogenase [Microbacterium protaetiae]